MDTQTNPIVMIQDWLTKAEQTEINDANAISLATVGKDMMPNVRIVLLKEIAAEGLYFYTNQTSQKARELAENSQAAICIHWKSLRRQVRVRGTISPASAEKSDAYFASRHPTSQIGAWASQQSQPLASRALFEHDLESAAERFKNGEPIPRPPHWGGYLLTPLSIEFWEEKEYRLHTRQLFTRTDIDTPWDVGLLYP
tara:strand:- start:146508 stop:147101 length:594 start_codon:yes stop_codon:yes gene_type:complete